MQAYVVDVETSSNAFVLVATHYRTDETKVFVVHSLRNDFIEMMDFLENCAENGTYIIGFNSLNFDGQILHRLMVNRPGLETMDPETIATRIYARAQKIIDNQDFGTKFPEIPEWQMSLKHIDIFKTWAFDNPQKRASLKWLQFTQDWPTVLEMPIHHAKRIETLEEIQIIIDYCINDVAFTKHMYEKTKPMLKIRQDIAAKYKLQCLSYSDIKLGSELLLKLYSKKTGKKRFQIKSEIVKRHKVEIGPLIFPYIKFKSEEFSEILEAFRDTTIINTRGDVQLSAKYKTYRFDYGTGGLHMSNPGIYKTDDEYLVLDIDVASMYPSIACVNKMYPAHLGPEFYQVYKSDIVDVRLAEKRKGDKGNKAIVDGYKLSANSTFGSSNNEHSWLQDPAYTLQTTINGQMLLSMLIESLLELDCELIQANTDGITLKIKQSLREQVMEKCKAWEEVTGLTLEYKDVNSAFLWDCNSFLMKIGDEIKAKGRFQTKDLEPHKNKSFMVIPKGIYEYFVNGVDPSEYLSSNENIYDYCGGNRANGHWSFKGLCTDNPTEEAQLQKVVRYYISDKGCKIIKENKSDGRRINVVAGPWLLTEFNSYYQAPFKDYGVNLNYYSQAIWKEIRNLQGKDNHQLELGF